MHVVNFDWLRDNICQLINIKDITYNENTTSRKTIAKVIFIYTNCLYIIGYINIKYVLIFIDLYLKFFILIG